MITLADAFLADILANPDDDAPRLILADWLDERNGPGDAARAEFIRCQCALADPNAPWRAALEARESALLAGHREEWARKTFRLPLEGIGCLTYRRGFVECVTATCRAWLARGAEVVRAAPLRQVRLVDFLPTSNYDNAMHVWGYGFNDYPVCPLLPDGWWPTEEAALKALSDACLAYARGAFRTAEGVKLPALSVKGGEPIPVKSWKVNPPKRRRKAK